MAEPVPRRSATTNPHPRAPLAAGWALRRIRELAELAPVVGGRLGAATRADPVPPRRLRARAGAPGATEYADGGRVAAAELAVGLDAAGRSPAELCAVLDFGCGAGRVLPHFSELVPGARLVGCDVDQAAIEWARRHRPGPRWELSSFAPPLPFEPESFDLIYSISVFSHLGASLPGSWLRELRRVLAPDGIALLSVHGRHAFEQFRTGRVRSAWCAAEMFQRPSLAAEEFVFAPYTRSMWTEGELPGVGREYGLAFHGDAHIRGAWGRELDVLDVLDRALTGWQDLVVCRKPA
jgi:SAM-dependent methyltransferase